MSKIKAEGYELIDNYLFRISSGNQNVFEIPMYQRPYVWRKDNWEELFNDITDNEPGYFIGAIICINNGVSDNNNYTLYEVVDGQQRLTTLSLFLAAIYKALVVRQEILKKTFSQEEFFNFLMNYSGKFTGLKNSLIVSSGEGKFRTRVLPHNKDNIDDYFNVLINAGLITEETLDYDEEIKKNTDGRLKHLITKAYEYFMGRIIKYAEGYNGEYKDNIIEQINRILEIMSKVNSSQLVMIRTDSHSSANILFETLNNRGTPLTITDLIKNRLLSALEKNCKNDFKKLSRRLIDIINGITKKKGKDISSGEQERFFRHSYNAFRTEWKKISGAPKLNPGKRANLYESYIKMIDFKPQEVFDQIKISAKIYPRLQGEETAGLSTRLNEAYKDLSRINGATSYTLLLYLVKNRESLNLTTNEDFEKICRLLVSFFVRHSFTDNPPANRLDSIFINYIDEIEENNYVGDSIREHLVFQLKKAYGTDDDKNDEKFKTKLRGNVYATDSVNTAIRFVLVKLAESYLGKEAVALWKKNNSGNSKSDFYSWTIEHILPQTLKSDKEWGKDWIKMLADGDAAKALEIQAENANRLGNLTLTAYNAELSNRPFIEKKSNYADSILAKGLNSYVCEQEKWGAEQIQKRTGELIEKILSIFAW